MFSLLSENDGTEWRLFQKSFISLIFFFLQLTFRNALLVRQVVELGDSVSLLTGKLTEAEAARALLAQARTNLRQDIRVKAVQSSHNLN